jgi:hypothetical protein
VVPWSPLILVEPVPSEPGGDTFDVGTATDTCYQNKIGSGVIAVINNCKSPQSGEWKFLY